MHADDCFTTQKLRAQDGSGNTLLTNDAFSFSGAGPASEGFPTAFNLTPNGTSANTQVYNLVLFGSSNQVTITETPKSGYVLATNSALTNCVEQSGGLPNTNDSTMNATTGTATIIAEEAELITCTFTNVRQNASLTVVKTVVNSYGGTATASSFNLHVKSGGTDVSNSPHAGSSSGTTYTVAPGTYVVSEDTPPTGYTQTSIVCGTTSGGTVTLTAGQSVTCTVTNQDVQPILRVIKSVTNSAGGTKQPADFSLHVKLNGSDVTGSPAAGLASPGHSYNLNAGSYVVSEDAVSGYTQTGITCGPTGGTLVAANAGSVTLSVGDDKTCIVANQDSVSQTSLSSIQNWTLNDSATISNVRAGGGSATVTFLLFSPDNSTCVQGGTAPATAPIFTFTANIDSTASGNVTVSTTGGPTVTKQGTYKWWVSYSGNSYNQAQAGSCGNESVTISASPAQNQ